MTRPLAVLLATAALLAPGLAAAQGPKPGQPQPVQSIIQGGNQDQPVQIDAAALEVRDKKKTATFSGDVQVVQGDTTMKCQNLVVYYGKEVGLAANAPGGGKPASDAGATNAQNIRRIEASGGVTVVTKDQNASGDLGVYDLIEKTITLTGNVVVSQGQNVIHGQRVVVDTLTGNARVEASAQGGGTAPNRVRALILPSHDSGSSGNFMTIGPGH